MQLGLPAPGAAPSGPPPINIGGVLPMMSASRVLRQQSEADNALTAQKQNDQPVIQGISGHVKAAWEKAQRAKLDVQDDMLEALLARRGQYTSEMAEKIKKQSQPLIYMMLAAAKMRQVEALLRDVLIGAGTEKPWTLAPTPVPDLPNEYVQMIGQALQMEIEQVMAMGLPISMEDARTRAREMKDMVDAKLQEEAKVRCSRMENKMEDQLVEGYYLDALDQFVSDIATFKTAFVAGPIIRKKPRMSWGQDMELVVQEELCLEWERVDPFDVYPAPWARHIGEGPLIRRHKLTREDLVEMDGVEGYSSEAIKEVLKQYGDSGLHNWLTVDSQRAQAEGKTQIDSITNTGLIDALQYWGSASGKMLLDWGIDPASVPDASKEYQVEVWLIGSWAIKAVLNDDPLARRPLYACSFQRVPGTVWGNSPYDLMRDCQDMCNSAARSLAANLGIASGPQVAINSDRVPADEDITEMFPWKLWEFTNDPMGGNADPIKFFQPTSNAAELMTVYERFSQLADEYTGIPRYTTGLESGNAGRTASGLSMMLGNASKIIKQVVGSIDFNVIQPILERLFYYNMRYSQDPELKGDVRVMARGALSLQTKEAAQVRINEFLAATNNPVDLQIIGMDGRAEMLRKAAQRLDLNADRVVPPTSVLKQRAMMAEMQAQQMAEQQGPQLPAPKGNGQQLENGAPVTDNFQPQGTQA